MIASGHVATKPGFPAVLVRAGLALVARGNEWCVRKVQDAEREIDMKGRKYASALVRGPLPHEKTGRGRESGRNRTTCTNKQTLLVCIYSDSCLDMVVSYVQCGS